METWRKTLAQFRELFNSMAPSQRMTLVAVPVMVLCGLGLVMYLGRGTTEQYLNQGKPFSSEELKHAEEALRTAGLTQYRSEGGKISVPKGDITRYEAALVANGVKAEFGADMEAIHKSFGIFDSDKQRLEVMEITKAKELAKIIRAIPGVEDASVIWERARQKAFGGDSKVTCVVSVRMRGGREVSSELAQSLRYAVSGGISGLSPADVTVFDISTGFSSRQPEKDDPFNSQYIDQIKKFTTMHQRNISEALSYIPNAIVSVNVDLENLKTSWQREQKFDAKPFAIKNVEETSQSSDDEHRPSSEPGVGANTPRRVKDAGYTENKRTSRQSTNSTENVPVTTTTTDQTFVGLLPKLVQVTVAIPEDYYRAVAVQQGFKPGESEADKQKLQGEVERIKKEVNDKVKAKVAKLIPPTGSAIDPIDVNSYVRLDSNATPTDIPMMFKMGEAATQWGGPASLALFALFALFMLNRSMKKLPDTDVPVPVSKLTPASEDEEEEEEPAPKEATKRDQLQSLVRDNPELAAAVIGRWIEPPK